LGDLKKFNFYPQKVMKQFRLILFLLFVFGSNLAFAQKGNYAVRDSTLNLPLINNNTIVGTKAAPDLNGSGNDNTLFGSYAGFKLNTGGSGGGGVNGLTLIGSKAGYNYATTSRGIINATFVGAFAGYNDGTGVQSINGGVRGGTFIGYKAGYAGGNPESIAIGVEAGLNGVSANSIMIGASSGALRGSINQCNNDVYIGTKAGYNFGGQDNTFIGTNAGSGSDTQVLVGYENVYIGSNSGQLSNSNSNTFVGANTGKVNLGPRNTLLGNSAGINMTGNSGENTFLGYGSGANCTSCELNTFIGNNSDAIVPSGSAIIKSVAIGNNAKVTASNSMVLGGTGVDAVNVGIGNTAPQNKLEITSATTNTSGLRFTNLKSTSTPSTANSLGLSVDANGDVILVPSVTANTGVYGQSYFQPVKPVSNTGDYNSYVGVSAGIYSTTGYNNSFFGYNAGAFNNTGYRNSFFGYNAGVNNGGGYDNSFYGHGAGGSNAGYANAYFGSGAGQSNSSGFANTFIGYAAGQIGVGGDRNTYLGYTSGLDNGGNDNTFVGLGSGRGITNSNLNVCIGKDAGFAGNSNGAGTQLTNVTLIGGLAKAVGNLTNASAIGYNTSVTASNSLILGNAVNVGIGNTAPNNRLEITSATTNTSGLRFTNLKSTSTPSTSNSLGLSVDANGDVILVPSGGALPVGADVWDQLTNGADYLIRNKNNKSVMIGTVAAAKTSIDYKLYVEKGILAEKVKVSAQANWPDYVFGKDYSLMPLKEVENYINANNHLPEVPSAEVIAKDGLDLGKMDATLLKKVEELTLYLIEQSKQLSAQQQTILKLQEKINSIEQAKK
jgi:trimeric autotransporter adhesin